MKTQSYTIYRMQQKQFLGGNFIVIEDFFKNKKNLSKQPNTSPKRIRKTTNET